MRDGSNKFEKEEKNPFVDYIVLRKWGFSLLDYPTSDTLSCPDLKYTNDFGTWRQ